MEDRPESPDLEARVLQLERQVAWLLERTRPAGVPQAAAPAQPSALPSPQPKGQPTRPHATQPVPAPKPKPAKETNPVIFIAAAGAGIFLIGALFFLRYAVEQGWVGPELRFLMGLLAGGAITALAANRLLKGVRLLGAAVLLAGLGTLVFSFYAGAFLYHFFPPPLGLAAVGCAALVAGALAARTGSPAAFGVSFLAAFVAPFVFSQGGHHEVALSVYLLVLMAAALTLPYLAKAGARWAVSRWLVLVPVWLALAGASSQLLKEDAGSYLALLIAHYVAAGLWIWLPGAGEKPSTPTLLWFPLSLGMTGLTAWLWHQLGLDASWFALPVLGFGAINLGLVKPLRARLGGRQADLGLLVLAGGHLALAVPVALEWRWVGPLWGAFAVLLAWAAGRAEELPDWEGQEALSLRLLALGMSILATLRWMVAAVDSYDWSYWGGPKGVTPFFNGCFATALLAALAWGLLARRGRVAGVFGFLGLQFVGNVALAFEVARLAREMGADRRGAAIAITLVWALSGALQWLRGLTQRTKALRLGLSIAGYAWLGIASFKLIALDLSESSMALRALVFLGVGAIFLAAALLGQRIKPAAEEAEGEDA